MKNKKSQTSTKLYRTWLGIKARCVNPRDIMYKNYGAKGIKVAEVWSKDFPAFKVWFDTYNIPEELLGSGAGKYTIGRLDHTKDYTPENCDVRLAKSDLSNSKLYNQWSHIKSMCYSPTNASYKTHGGRGVKMCDEWKNDFRTFKKWYDTFGIPETNLGGGAGKYSIVLNENSLIYSPEGATVKSNHKPTTSNKLYNLYTNIKSKLYNPKSPRYSGAGGIGITMDNEWKNNFATFKKWYDTFGIPDYMIGPKEGQYTVARIDKHGDYTPENCEVRLSKGVSNSKLYSVWADIKTRCYNANSKPYRHYGGRGIKMCESWKNDFMEFKKWFDSLDYVLEKDIRKDKYTIDRIDVNGDYCPDNCRFALPSVQGRNTRRINASNITGYRGVTEDYGKFRASVVINSKRIHLGKSNTRYEAALVYDKYIKDNNLEHTTNDLILDKYVVLKPIDYILVPYSSKNDYMLSGIYTRILNGLELNNMLTEFAKEHKLDIPKITKTLKSRVVDIDDNDQPIVVENAINKLAINIHKEQDNI